MPRNSSGTYSLYTPGNPVVTNTVISSTWANNTLADLASAITDSLSRTGDGGMQAPLELDNGAVGAPALTWASETTSGLYRASAGNFRFSVSAADALTVTGSGLVVGAATGGGQGAGTINAVAFYDDGVLIAGANPTGTIGLTAVNGSAGTFLRSDGAPALSQAIAPTWSGTHTFSKALAGLDAGIVLASVTPGLVYYETDQAVDNRYWRQFIAGGTLNWQTIDDAQSGGKNFLAVARSSNAISSVSFGNATDNNTFSFLGTGTITAGGVFLAPDGSNTNAAYSNNGDPNTGIYFPAADDMWMTLGGTGYPIGYRGMPSRTITTSDSTAATDNGRTVLFTGAGSQTFTVDSDFGTASNIMVILNGGTGSLAIAESLSGTMTWLNGGGSLSTGSRTLAIGGIATIWMVDATNAYIWGSGIS